LGKKWTNRTDKSDESERSLSTYYRRINFNNDQIFGVSLPMSRSLTCDST